MLVLYETPAGFALFTVASKDDLTSSESVAKHFESAKSAKKLIKLKAFKQFSDTNEALKAASSLIDGSIDKNLKSFLKEQCKGTKEELAVCDAKFGNIIKEKLGIPCVFDNTIAELFRGIRTHVNELVQGLDEGDMRSMSVGLAHSLARHKLQFSSDKVDTMIIQAIGLLDDIDKELNTYAMRVREWYGWHFPELTKIIPDNLMYARVIKKMGMRSNAQKMEFGDILPEELEADMKQMAIISMGTEISETDMANIRLLTEQVITISEYRAQLFEYLKNRMAAIAPNLTTMVGEMVGARLVAHAGSLLSLAKHPASTVQILGAEKALFRALKTKKQTPKYGLIYHASMVGQSATKNKGKMSRVLANKVSLSARVDALGDSEGPTIALQDRAKLEQRMRQLEGGETLRISGTAKAKSKQMKYEAPQVPTYDTSTDVVMTPSKKRKASESSDDEDIPNGTAQETKSTPQSAKKEKKEKKEKRKKEADGEEPPKKKKKKSHDDGEASKDKKDKKEKKEKKEKKDKKDKKSKKSKKE